MTADNGALTPVIDKPEQALDLLRDAISCAGYNFEDDVAVAIKLATKDIYDQVIVMIVHLVRFVLSCRYIDHLSYSLLCRHVMSNCKQRT